MSNLVRPHGSAALKPLLLEGTALTAERARAAGLLVVMDRCPMVEHKHLDG